MTTINATHGWLKLDWRQDQVLIDALVMHREHLKTIAYENRSSAPSTAADCDRSLESLEEIIEILKGERQ